MERRKKGAKSVKPPGEKLYNLEKWHTNPKCCIQIAFFFVVRLTAVQRI